MNKCDSEILLEEEKNQRCQLTIKQGQNHRYFHAIGMNVEDGHVVETERKLLMEKTGVNYSMSKKNCNPTCLTIK